MKNRIAGLRTKLYKKLVEYYDLAGVNRKPNVKNIKNLDPVFLEENIRRVQEDIDSIRYFEPKLRREEKKEMLRNRIKEKERLREEHAQNIQDIEDRLMGRRTRYASEILSDLESRVERLESRRASVVGRYSVWSSDEGEELLLQIEKMLREGKQGSRTFNDLIEEVEDFLDEEYLGHIALQNSFQVFKMSLGRNTKKQSFESLSVVKEILQRARKAYGKDRSKEASSSDFSPIVKNKIIEELNKYSGLGFKANSIIDVKMRETSKKSNSDFVLVSVESGREFAYVLFEYLPMGFAFNFDFYDLEDWSTAKKNFSKIVRRGKI